MQACNPESNLADTTIASTSTYVHSTMHNAWLIVFHTILSDTKNIDSAPFAFGDSIGNPQMAQNYVIQLNVSSYISDKKQNLVYKLEWGYVNGPFNRKKVNFSINSLSMVAT